MRSAIIVSAIAAASLTAFAAQAQQSVDPLNSVAPTVAPSTAPASGDQKRTEHKHRHGDNAKARDARTTVMDNYAQTTDQRPGNDAGYLVPYGPPR